MAGQRYGNLLWEDNFNQSRAYVVEYVQEDGSGKPLEVLDLTRCSHPSEIPGVVHSFLVKYKRLTRRKQTLPFYSLTLPQRFYTTSNMDLLKKLLTNFGEKVAGMTIELPSEGLSYPAALPALTLPALRSLTVVYAKQRQPELPGGSALPPFIQAIVCGAGNLEDVGVIHPIHCKPVTLTLPPAIKSLRLQDVQANPDWCLPGKLENVENLLLSISPTLMEENPVDAIFRKLPSLKKVVVWFTPCLSRIPETSNGAIFLPENAVHLETLHVWNVKSSVFHDWTLNNGFPGVRNLSVTMMKDWPDIRASSILWASPTPRYLYGISLAFPNLRKLSLLLAGNDLLSLPYLFKTFTKLEELRLDLNYTTFAEPLPVALTSKFLGVTIEEASKLNKQKQWSESDSAKIGSANTSILNLKKLKILRVNLEGAKYEDIITPAFFNLGAAKMPKLTTINAGGSSG